MHAFSTLLHVGLFAIAMPASAANVSVTFLQPEDYADAGYSRPFASERDRAEVQRDIEQHLKRLAARNLRANESLEVEILDIDLAGRFEPFLFRNAADVRIVRDITWPRIKLRYVLSRGGQVVASAQEQLTDMNFMVSGNRYSSGDRLRYEKAMLDEWFEKRIGKR